MNSTQPQSTAWKNPWFLLVVGLPAVVVVACFITLYLAIKAQDPVISDDYYKEGLAINQDLRRDQKADEYGLSGQLTLVGQTAQLTLQSHDAVRASLAGLPLQLMLENMGVPSRDQKITLVPTGQTGQWRGQLKQLPSKGAWRVHVETADWRLTAHVDGVLDKPIVLK